MWCSYGPIEKHTVMVVCTISSTLNLMTPHIGEPLCLTLNRHCSLPHTEKHNHLVMYQFTVHCTCIIIMYIGLYSCLWYMWELQHSLGVNVVM